MDSLLWRIRAKCGLPGLGGGGYRGGSTVPFSNTARTRLTSRAAREGTTATALLDQLIIEGTDQLDFCPVFVLKGRLEPGGLVSSHVCGQRGRAHPGCWSGEIDELHGHSR
jgi:hypothetical protein